MTPSNAAMIGASGSGTPGSYHVACAGRIVHDLAVKRLLPLVLLCGCELTTGLSDLEKDPDFNPDAAVVETGTVDSTTTDTGTMVTTDTGTTPMMDSTVADTPKADTAMDAGGCGEPESKTLGGKCYFPLKTNMAWSEAKTACEGKGAKLAKITTTAQNDLIKTIDAASERWIGLSRAPADPNVKESYKWTDGSAFDAAMVDGWAMGEPNDGDAVRMKPDGLWYDRAGSTATVAGIHAMCEK